MSSKIKTRDSRQSSAFSIPDLRELRKARLSKRPSTRVISMDKPPPPFSPIEVAPVDTLVFLYVQLRDITNLGNNSDLKLKVTDTSNLLTQLTPHAKNQNNWVDVKKVPETKPTFSMTLRQDNVEQLNTLFDAPIHVTMYRLPEKQADEEERHGRLLQWGVLPQPGDEFEESEMTPTAVGFIDLLQFFSKKRQFTELKTFLYPMAGEETTTGTAIAHWHLYTLLPLIQDISFYDIAYIMFESIYNFPNYLAMECRYLSARLSLQLKQGANTTAFVKPEKKIRLCSYTGFTNTLIANQTVTHKWENLKSDETYNREPLGIQSDFRVRLHKLFNSLQGTDGVNFCFDEINKDEDNALVCNSLHRFLLDRKTLLILEEIIAIDMYEMVVEIYSPDKTETLVLEGTVDLAILLYPQVNSCRFAVALKPVKRVPGHHELENMDHGPIFCIIQICMFVPITDAHVDMSDTNATSINLEKLRACAPVARREYQESPSNICVESYRHFDDLVYHLANMYITEPWRFGEGKPGFSCEQSNMVNKVLKLVACDFNRRIPTKTNLEFTNMMTVVYKELEQRIADFLSNWEINLTLYGMTQERQVYMIKFVNLYKCLTEVGDIVMAQHFYQKLIQEFPSNRQMEFYFFLCNLEWQKMTEIRLYTNLPRSDRLSEIDYECILVNIYLDYLNEISDEIKSPASFENLLRKLEEFCFRNEKHIDGWILLYCAYNKCKYNAGKEYARWQYENLFNRPRRTCSVGIPKMRWELHNSSQLEFETEKLGQFYITFKFLLMFGMYKFAELVFLELSPHCTNVERYNTISTFKILCNDVNVNDEIFTFPPVPNKPNAIELTIMNAQLNGSMEYLSKEDKSFALKYYQQLMDISLPSYMHVSAIQLGLFRYAYSEYERKEFHRTMEALEKTADPNDCGYLVSQFLRGKCLYKENHLKQAQLCFIECTKSRMHIADVWAYLALINLKRGKTFEALECWKYARLDPTIAISEEIIDDLNSIDTSNIYLYVDKPLQQNDETPQPQ